MHSLKLDGHIGVCADSRVLQHHGLFGDGTGSRRDGDARCSGFKRDKLSTCCLVRINLKRRCLRSVLGISNSFDVENEIVDDTCWEALSDG